MAKAGKKKAVKQKPGVIPGNATHKLSEDEFWHILAVNGGYYAQTAYDIERKFKIKFTRSAVKQRAERDPERLESIREAALDKLEKRMEFLSEQPVDFGVAFNATKFILTKRGKARGYGDDKSGVNVNVNKGEDDGADGSAVSLTIKISQ